jgi:hypothetical protein
MTPFRNSAINIFRGLPMTIKLDISKNSSFDKWMMGSTLVWLILPIAYVLFGWFLRGEIILYWLVIATNQTLGFFMISQFVVAPIGSIIIAAYFIAQLILARFNYQSLIALGFLWAGALIGFVTFLAIAILGMDGGAFYNHMSSASLGWYRYHLAYIGGGHGTKLFRCDPAGIICLQIDQIYELSRSDELIASPEDGRLYVEHGGEIVYVSEVQPFFWPIDEGSDGE